MIKEIKDNLETDLATVTGLHVLGRNILDKGKVTAFPAVSLISVALENTTLGDSENAGILRLGLAVFVTNTQNLDEELDDLYESILALDFDNTLPSVMAIRFRGFDYDAFNDGSNVGTAYIALEIEFLN